MIGFLRDPFYTLENYLANSSDSDLLSSYNSTSRNEIRRCLNDNISFYVMNDYETFMLTYNDFARRKSLSPVNRNQLDSYGKDLVLTASISGSRVLAMHAYLTLQDENRVRLLYSCTSEAQNDSFSSSSLGRANKFLHFKDMCYFRDNGFRIYDFGGITKNTSDKSKAGINAFKDSFGGKEVRYTNYTSILAALILLLAKISSLFKHKEALR